jgi:Domain of unknown function (DUF4129)
MTPGKKALLVVARAGMEISWRYAWVGFLMLLVSHQVFPFAETAGAFFGAIIVNRLATKHNWRLYQGLLLEAAGLILLCLLILYRLWYASIPFFSLAWLSALFQDPMSLTHRYLLLLILFCLLMIWRGGRALVTQPMDYDHVCIQFDKGIGLLILLLIIKFLIQEKADIIVDGLALGFLVGAFFVFSLLSIFLTRKQPDIEKSFMTGYHGIGITLSLTTGLILFGSGAVFFFYPVLTQVADSSLTVVKSLTEPLVPSLVSILLLLFSPGKLRTFGNVESDRPMLPDDLVNTPISDWMGSLLNTISMGLVVLMGIMGLFFLGLILRNIFRLLMKKNTNDHYPGRSSSWLMDLFRWFSRLSIHVWHFISSLLRGVENATRVYMGLLGWGKRSGLRLRPSETPTEYGRRLVRHFPHLDHDITLIVQAFNREVYGNIRLDPKVLSRLLSARRRLRHIRYWPSRVKVSFFR